MNNEHTLVTLPPAKRRGDSVTKIIQYNVQPCDFTFNKKYRPAPTMTSAIKGTAKTTNPLLVTFTCKATIHSAPTSISMKLFASTGDSMTLLPTGLAVSNTKGVLVCCSHPSRLRAVQGSFS